jgi:hypothetical protein
LPFTSTAFSDSSGTKCYQFLDHSKQTFSLMRLNKSDLSGTEVDVFSEFLLLSHAHHHHAIYKQHRDEYVYLADIFKLLQKLKTLEQY